MPMQLGHIAVLPLHVLPRVGRAGDKMKVVAAEDVCERRAELCIGKTRLILSGTLRIHSMMAKRSRYAIDTLNRMPLQGALT
jgi:hypothetical protein